MRAKKKIAQQIVDKLETPVENMKASQAAELTMYVPRHVMGSASTALNELKGIFANAKVVVNNPQHELIIEDLQAVVSKLKECLRLDKKVTMVVASLERIV